MKSVDYYLSQLQGNSEEECDYQAKQGYQVINKYQEYEEEEEARVVPKPTRMTNDFHSKNLTSDKSKSNRSAGISSASNYGGNNQTNNQPHPNINNMSYKEFKEYIPDTVAYKIVEDILNKKF